MKHVRFSPDKNLTMTSEEVATVRITEESLNIVDESSNTHQPPLPVKTIADKVVGLETKV